MTRYRDTIAGIAVIAIAIALFAATFGIKEFSQTSLGADFVPRITAVVFALLGVVLIVRERRQNRMCGNVPPAAAPAGEKEGLTGAPAVFLNIALFALYLYFLETVGFLLLTPVFLFFQILLLTNPRKYRIGLFIVLSVAVSVISYYMFVNVFTVMLPNGLLE